MRDLRSQLPSKLLALDVSLWAPVQFLAAYILSDGLLSKIPSSAGSIRLAVEYCHSIVLPGPVQLAALLGLRDMNGAYRPDPTYDWGNMGESSVNRARAIVDLFWVGYRLMAAHLDEFGAYSTGSFSRYQFQELARRYVSEPVQRPHELGEDFAPGVSALWHYETCWRLLDKQKIIRDQRNAQYQEGRAEVSRKPSASGSEESATPRQYPRFQIPDEFAEPSEDQDLDLGSGYKKVGYAPWVPPKEG